MQYAELTSSRVGVGSPVMAPRCAGRTVPWRREELRVDTTVVPANVAYPTDSGLLARAVRRITRSASGFTPPVARCAPGCGTGRARRERIRILAGDGFEIEVCARP